MINKIPNYQNNRGFYLVEAGGLEPPSQISQPESTTRLGHY